MMLWKKTTVMLISFGVVTLLAILAAAIPTGGTGPVLTLPVPAKDAVTKIAFLNVATPFSLEKSGSAWVVMPGKYPVNDKRIETALDMVSGLKTGGMISKGSAQFDTYEVPDDGTTLSVGTASGEAYRVILGKESSDKRGSYLRIPGDARVFIGLGHLKTGLPTDIKSWRDRTVAKFEKEKATELEIESEGKVISFKKDGSAWAFDKKPEILPPEYRLDPAKVEKAIQAISNLNASEFKDDAKNLAEIGLEPPALKATVKLSEGEPVTLLFGKESDKKVPAKKAGQDQIYLVSSFQKDQVPSGFEGYRDMHVTSFTPEDAVKVEVVKEKDRLVFNKDVKWQIQDSSEKLPDGFILDPAKVDSLARSASKLEGKTLVGKGAPAAAGIGSKGLIKVTLKDGAVKLIRFGNETGDKEIYLEGDGGFVYLAAAGSATRLLKKLEDFKVTAQAPQQQQPAFSPEMLNKLPPGVREQFMQQQKQKIMQNQLIKQMMKGKDKEPPPDKKP